MRRPALALALAVWVLVPTLAALSGCTTRRPVTDRFVLDGGRSYVLHYDRAAESGRPLVVMLHPLAAGPAWAESVTGISQYADRHNFSVAYPAASTGKTTSSWNAGECCDGKPRRRRRLPHRRGPRRRPRHAGRPAARIRLGQCPTGR